MKELADAFRDASVPEITLRFDEAFGKDAHTLGSLFKDEQRKILDLIIAPLIGEAEAAHIHLYGRRCGFDALPCGSTDPSSRYVLDPRRSLP